MHSIEFDFKIGDKVITTENHLLNQSGTISEIRIDHENHISYDIEFDLKLNDGYSNGGGYTSGSIRLMPSEIYNSKFKIGWELIYQPFLVKCVILDIHYTNDKFFYDIVFEKTDYDYSNDSKILKDITVEENYLYNIEGSSSLLEFYKLSDVNNTIKIYQECE